MYLDRNTSLGFISALALMSAFGCSSKNTSGDQGGGGVCSFNCGSVGGSGGIDAGLVDVKTICDGLFSGCKSNTTSQTVKIPNMLIVIDESGSMNQMASSTSTGSKWVELRQALAAALSQPKVHSNINFGLELFPNSGDPDNPIDPASTDPNASCQVPVGDAAIEVPIDQSQDQLNAILDTVNAAHPTGGTPTSRALQQALEYFTQGAGKTLPGKKYVLLATDGGPNCNAGLSCAKETCTQNMDLLCGDHTANTTINCCDGAGYVCLDEAATINAIQSLKAAGIVTYVVGIPGSEAYSTTLDSMAVAGGVPNTSGTTQYYAVSAANSLADLQTAFTDIVTTLVTSCDIPLATAPKDAFDVKVAIDCNLVNLVAADAGLPGFYIQYTPSDTNFPARLELVGSTCDNMTLNGAKEVDVLFGCGNVM